MQAFQSLGMGLGMSTGSHELHYLLEDAFDGDEISDSFLYRVESMLTFAAAPLYAALHEACYAQGAGDQVGRAPGQGSVPARSAPKRRWTARIPCCSPARWSTRGCSRPTRCCGRWPTRRRYSPSMTTWPRLYDPARLAANEVPAAAAVYYDDMYVPQQFSVDTAARVRGLRRWVTSEYEHDGLRLSGGAVLDRLIGMVRGTI